jgi:hypothetical protein
VIWSDAAPLISELQRATAGGGCLVIKIDNERTDDDIFTVVITGARYGGRFFRKDGANLLGILREALDFCAARV